MSSKFKVSGAKTGKKKTFPQDRKAKIRKTKKKNPPCTLRYDGQWMDNKAAEAAWTDGQRSPRRERRSYFTADCLMLPTRANYTDYSCESCMAELYNYKDPVPVIMCCEGKKKNLMEILVLQVTSPLGDFSTVCGTLSIRLGVSLRRVFISLPVMQHSKVSVASSVVSVKWQCHQ